MANLCLSDRIIINEFKEKNKWICYYCNINITRKEDLTVDHKTPLSRGGITEETNLAISCVKCNREKDNMTEMEYLLFKDKKLEAYESLGFVHIIDKLFSLYDDFIKEAQMINSEYVSTEKRAQRIINEIADNNFNAYQGYLLAKELRESVRYKNRLKVAKDAYNTLHTLIGNNKKNLQEVNQKIVDNLMSSQYNKLKISCIENRKNSNSVKYKKYVAAN